MEEIWKDIPEYEGFYQASNKGRIKSLSRTVKSRNKRIIKERILKLTKKTDGYITVGLSKLGKIKSFGVHRLVAYAFIQYPIELPLEVCHNDGTRDNNVLENLRIDTKKNNCLERTMHGTQNYQKGETNGRCILSDKECLKILQDDRSQVAIANEYNVSPSLIYLLKKRKIRKYLFEQTQLDIR